MDRRVFLSTAAAGALFGGLPGPAPAAVAASQSNTILVAACRPATHGEDLSLDALEWAPVDPVCRVQDVTLMRKGYGG